MLELWCPFSALFSQSSRTSAQSETLHFYLLQRLLRNLFLPRLLPQIILHIPTVTIALLSPSMSHQEVAIFRGRTVADPTLFWFPWRLRDVHCCLLHHKCHCSLCDFRGTCTVFPTCYLPCHGRGINQPLHEAGGCVRSQD